jgi:hypothetical protein
LLELDAHNSILEYPTSRSAERGIAFVTISGDLKAGERIVFRARQQID